MASSQLSDPASDSPSSSSSLLSISKTQHSSHAFAFLNHSQETLPNRLPPSVDNKALTRQKRKRTSAEDHAILESEFQRDSRPDKAARSRIVERVALGEKEVQIWFQNRRQNSRRKSRPLLPSEIFSQLSSSPMNSRNSSVTGSYATRYSPLEEIECNLPADNLFRECVPSLATQQSASDDHSNEIKSSASSTQSSQNAVSHLVDQNQPCQFLQDVSAENTQGFRGPEMQQARRRASFQALSEHQLPSCGYISDRRSVQPGSAKDERESSEQYSHPLAFESGGDPLRFPSVDAPAPRLSRRSSLVRLSTTREGNAKVITLDECLSSPQKHRSKDRTDLEIDGHLPVLHGQLAPLSHRVSGWSRDSRAWEFWCDSDAKTTLLKKAEQEQSGSAAEAIGLMRSKSRGAPTPTLRKRSERLSRHHSARSRDEYRPKKRTALLERSLSTVEWLQSGPNNTDDFKRSSRGQVKLLPNNDSDKENQEPSTQNTNSGWPKILPTCGVVRVERRALGESRQAVNQNSFNEERENRKEETSALGMKCSDLEKDVELATFMRIRESNKERRAAAVGEDLDCIQGLLSLSQGNWN